MTDPTGAYLDTTATDPWPVLRLAPGLYKCASFTRPRSVAYLVDLRGPRPICAHPHWNGLPCKHINEVERQAPAIEAALRNSEAAARDAA